MRIEKDKLTGKKYVAKTICKKGLLCRIYKNSLTQQYKKKYNKKMIKRHDGTFPQRGYTDNK